MFSKIVSKAFHKQLEEFSPSIGYWTFDYFFIILPMKEKHIENKDNLVKQANGRRVQKQSPGAVLYWCS